MLDTAQTGSQRSKDEREEAGLREAVTCPKSEPERAGTRAGPKSFNTNLMGVFCCFVLFLQHLKTWFIQGKIPGDVLTIYECFLLLTTHSQ